MAAVAAGQTATTRHSFGVSGSTLRINLCPIGASCTAVVTEFVGPVSGSMMDLTYTVGGTAVAIYRFIGPAN